MLDSLYRLGTTLSDDFVGITALADDVDALLEGIETLSGDGVDFYVVSVVYVVFVVFVVYVVDGGVCFNEDGHGDVEVDGAA